MAVDPKRAQCPVRKREKVRVRFTGAAPLAPEIIRLEEVFPIPEDSSWEEKRGSRSCPVEIKRI